MSLSTNVIRDTVYNTTQVKLWIAPGDPGEWLMAPENLFIFDIEGKRF